MAFGAFSLLATGIGLPDLLQKIAADLRTLNGQSVVVIAVIVYNSALAFGIGECLLFIGQLVFEVFQVSFNTLEPPVFQHRHIAD